MKMDAISTEKIKPNSPTPLHLKIHKISLLDQIIVPNYIPLVLYFAPDPTFNNSDQSISRKIDHLKNSLGSTLTTFYPFAGIIKDALSVDCNDEGIPFSVAKVKTQIKDFLQCPDPSLLNKLLPGDFNFEKFPGPGENVCMIQLNCFDCGGIAISIIFAHYTADLTSVSTFLRAWAATARGSFQTTPLNCIAQSAFPQKVSLPIESNPFYPIMKFVTIAKFVTRRYVFDASSLSILKAQSNDLSPSRVEVATALIWKCLIDSIAEKSGNDDTKPFVLTHTVNLRRRADPPYPEDSFGNFLWPAAAVRTNHSVKCWKELVGELRRGMSRIDKEFIKRLQSDEGYFQNLDDCRKEFPEEANLVCFTSWTNMGLYDVDLGWGKPVWLSGIIACNASESMFPNSVTLLDTRTRDGIEAWVHLDEKYVAGFEKNEELKMHARFNPSVL